MSPSSTTQAGRMLFFFLLFGGLLAYWFYDASSFAHGQTINIGQPTFLPVYCSINSDKASDVRQTAQVYLWQSNAEIEVQSFVNPTISNGQTIHAHEIVTPSHTAYLWREDRPAGEIQTDVTNYPILEGIAKTNSWFCFPWILFDYTKFMPPKSVSFQ
jgi:hypothetical protein